jgi:hypothetical protein
MTKFDLREFVLENKAEADAYLDELFKKDQYRSIDEVRIRAEKYIRDAIIKKYFIGKAEEMLQDLR